MLENYLKIAWRQLVRNKAFSTINILGLAFGITCSVLIILWVDDERNVDAFHTNGKQLFQVYERNFYDGKVEASYPTQGLLAEELKRNIPQIAYASGFEYTAPPGTQNTIEAAGKVNKMTGMFAGADFLRMFTYPLLQGNAAAALTEPGSVAVSEKFAKTFFGSADKAMGQTMRFENKEDLTITAVFENSPSNSSQQFDFLRCWTDFVKQNDWVNNWGNTSPATYVQLRKDADASKVAASIKDFVYRYQQKNETFRTELDLQPYTEKYLHSVFKDGYAAGGRITYVRLFTVVAIFILLIACINFMNLSTARSVKRSREVGVRKVVGALRFSLIKQFIGEALLLTTVSMLIALVLVIIILPYFNSLTGKQLAFPYDKINFWSALFSLLLLTGIIAGSYPALFLSSLQPIKTLKGNLKFSLSSLLLRKGLVVFQFAVSIVLIVGMIVIYRQINYIQTTNIGYNRENLLYIPIEGELVEKYDLFKEEAGKENVILSISKMRNSPTVISHHNNSIEWPGKDPGLTVSFADGVVGYDFVKTLHLNLVEGRDFSKDFGSDSASYILNETAVKKIGLKDPIGQTVFWGNRPGKVIGVLQDFHFSSLHENIEPLILRHDENWSWGTILVRTKAAQTNEAIARLEKLCKSLNPKFPFTYQFSDLEYARLYQSEQIVGKLSNLFAFLAIFISCLGLFGLATFSAEQRTKEIGVRKVLGASVANVISLLVTTFLQPIIIAIFIAMPLAWYVMTDWLSGFAYKVNFEWWILPAACLLTILIAILTVSFQSIRSATVNPVNSLRTE